MKLSTTTLGCPNWSLPEAIEKVASYGYDGIDFRGIGQQMDVTLMPEFREGVGQTAARIREAGLVVSGLSSSVRCLPKDEAQRQEYAEELRRYCGLAPKLGCPMVRVFGGQVAEGMGKDEALKVAAQNLHGYGQIAAQNKVKIGLETHDDWCASTRVAELLQAAGHPAVGVLWDVEHPWRVTGEQPGETFANIGRWLIYTHFKDARRKDGGGLELCPFGQGHVPVRECMEALRAGGYEGWLTLEHEKRWHAELEEPEEAFPRYIEVMRGLIRPRRKGAR